MPMKKLSLLLALCLLLGAVVPGVAAGEELVIPFSQMQYTQMEIQQIQEQFDEAIALSQGNDLDALWDAVYAAENAVIWYSTNYHLASIRYFADLTDDYWEGEYDAYSYGSTAVEQGMNDLYYALAASPFRQALEEEFYGEGFFEAYDGENYWDDTLEALMDRENELVSQYYSQASQADNFFTNLFLGRDRKLAQTLVDLILVRKEIAACCGYDSYEEYANDMSYWRDYEPEEMDRYLLAIRKKLVPLYREYWSLTEDLPETHERDSLRYVRDAAQRMGGVIWDAFRVMEEGKLYDIGYSDRKYSTSFVVFLPGYQEPFLFFNPGRTAYDHLTLSHEFGHFCNDYASCGSVASVDVNEIFSQAMEYLSLLYSDGVEDLRTAKMADSLGTYVEQACLASFEREMYRLEEPSVDALCELYDRLASAYGFDSFDYDPMDFIYISHIYDSPMYLTSYIISNDAALQFYQMELEESGRGLEALKANLDTMQPWFLAFLEEAGLESPFASGRLDEVAELFETILSV